MPDKTEENHQQGPTSARTRAVLQKTERGSALPHCFTARSWPQPGRPWPLLCRQLSRCSLRSSQEDNISQDSSTPKGESVVRGSEKTRWHGDRHTRLTTLLHLHSARKECCNSSIDAQLSPARISPSLLAMCPPQKSSLLSKCRPDVYQNGPTSLKLVS